MHPATTTDIPAPAQCELELLDLHSRRRFEAALHGPDRHCVVEQLMRLADARQRGPGPKPPDTTKCDPRVASDNGILNCPALPYA